MATHQLFWLKGRVSGRGMTNRAHVPSSCHWLQVCKALESIIHCKSYPSVYILLTAPDGTGVVCTLAHLALHWLLSGHHDQRELGLRRNANMWRRRGFPHRCLENNRCSVLHMYRWLHVPTGWNWHDLKVIPAQDMVLDTCSRIKCPESCRGIWKGKRWSGAPCANCVTGVRGQLWIVPLAELTVSGTFSGDHLSIQC